MIAPWLILLGVLMLHAKYALSFKNAKPCIILTRLHAVIPQKPPAEAAQQEQEKQKPRWRPVFPTDMFVLREGVFFPKKKMEGDVSRPSPLATILDEVANFFSSARYGIEKEMEAKKEAEVKEVEMKVSGIMKDME